MILASLFFNRHFTNGWLTQWLDGVPPHGWKPWKVKYEGILDEDNDDSDRDTQCRVVCTTLEHFENIQATSILEMALWKWKIKSGWSNDGTKRRALDRDECRKLGGADLNVVISHVAKFFITPAARTSEE